ncbi:hypothetical protein BC834DRAFT_96968 [Gloeopeniophorella convolvens]|nr:hypothetical protein BC834DRAFT_96968 [Gloeopeniophorella convolvens]
MYQHSLDASQALVQMNSVPSYAQYQQPSSAYPPDATALDTTHFSTESIAQSSYVADFNLTFPLPDDGSISGQLSSQLIPTGAWFGPRSGWSIVTSQIMGPPPVGGLHPRVAAHDDNYLQLFPPTASTMPQPNSLDPPQRVLNEPYQVDYLREVSPLVQTTEASSRQTSTYVPNFLPQTLPSETDSPHPKTNPPEPRSARTRSSQLRHRGCEAPIASGTTKRGENAKKWACFRCNRLYYRQRDRKRHERSHFPKHLFCPISPDCPWRGHREDVLENHLRRRHESYSTLLIEQCKIYDVDQLIEEVKREGEATYEPARRYAHQQVSDFHGRR